MFSETGGLSRDEGSADRNSTRLQLLPVWRHRWRNDRGEKQKAACVRVRVRACVCVCIKARWLLSQLMELVQDSVRNQVCVWETEGVRVRARSAGCQRSWTKTRRYFWGRNMSGESNLQRFGEKRRSVNATAAGSEFKVNFDSWCHCHCCYSFNKGSTSSKKRFNEWIMRRSPWEHCKITTLMQ